MNPLSKSIALALPYSEGEVDAVRNSLKSARRGASKTEIRIGVGPITSIPARIFGYAESVAAAFSEVETVLGIKDATVSIFSSGPKSSECNECLCSLGLVALAGALRFSGVSTAIQLDLASSDREIPDNWQIELPDDVNIWLSGRQNEHANTNRSDLNYGHEHAAGSMFADISNDMDPPLRITIGGVAEARFWAIRMRVREAATRKGFRVAPALGLVMRPIRVPWYQRQTNPNEPTIEMLKDPRVAVKELADASNPKYGGNPGLKREATLLARCAENPRIPLLLKVLNSPELIGRYLDDINITTGNRFWTALRGLP